MSPMMNASDWLDLTVLERKKYNYLNETLDLTQQIGSALDHNDQISLKMLLAMRQEPIMYLEELKQTIEDMKTSREIELAEAGSIAEAALKLNGIFEAAQRAAEQYLMNVKRIGRNTPESTKGSDHQELSEELELTEEAEVAEQLAVPEERSISGTYQTVDRRTVRGQKIPYESGWRPVARRKKLHG